MECQTDAETAQFVLMLLLTSLRLLVGTLEKVAGGVTGQKTRWIYDRYNVTGKAARLLETRQAMVLEVGVEPTCPVKGAGF